MNPSDSPAYPSGPRLPAWGPYSKNLIGLSHVADARRGLRFDLSVFPGLYRRAVKIPAVRYESDYHPWDAAADLSYFSHRHVIDGRDRLYTDIAFARVDGDACTLRAVTHNLTDEPFLGVLHFMAALRFPPLSPNFDITLHPAVIEAPPGASYVGAEHYSAIRSEGNDPRRHLPWGGGPYLVGTRDNAVDGTGLYLRPEAGAVDLAYDVPVSGLCGRPALFLRYQSEKPLRVGVVADGGNERLLDLPACKEFSAAEIAALEPGERTARVEIRFPQCAGEFVDGLFVAEAGAAVVFFRTDWRPVPEMRRVGTAGLALKYPDLDAWYGIAWQGGDAEIRQFRCRELDPFMRDRVHDHVNETLGNDASGHFANVFLRPLRWLPRSESRCDGIVCRGPLDSVEARLLAFQADPAPMVALHDSRARSAIRLSALPSGADYVFSQERMAATLLAGVVYPVRCRGEWIAHQTPGRWWDSLYTWDAGFTALGLGTIDPARALDHVATYLVPPESSDQAAFVHYGTPVPTQLYAFKDAWEQAPDIATLRRFYPLLRNYHRFLAGRYPHSTTCPFRSGLVATWDYFYNSGGWDDYPPQQWVHARKLTGCVAPIANTAHAIRTAKMLATFGNLLGEPVDEFLEDIAALREGVVANAWDEGSGYFGYVVHDTDGSPAGILRTDTGENFNRGMDGLTPLIAGVGSPAQRRRMMENLMSPEHLMTPIGLTTVDQSASYYRRDGYWNGAVWMPHQWFFWKALLDLGEADAAFEIARRALDVWKAEVGASWNCFEHFIVETGRGAGWHQFTGLSCPVLAWFAAYFREGRITAGHHATVVERRACGEGGMRFLLAFDPLPPAEASTVIVTVPAGGTYSASCNGAQIPAIERHAGCLEITVPTGAAADVAVARA